MADININGQFEDMVNFTADFGTIQNSFPSIDPDVTPDSNNPVASKGIYEFVKDIEEDVDIRIDGVSDSLNREVNNRTAADELLQTQISAEENARISADNLLRQAYDNDHERIVNLSLTKQDNLVSGQNIKTVNGQSILGEGDIHIEGGSGDVKDVLVDETSVLGSDKIARIPRASSENSGTIKIGNGAQVNTAGAIRATALTKENYDSANGNTFVGKATLENVLNPIREEISGLDDKIKELELFKFPNVTIIGTPTINNGQISNFSATSYLKFPFLVDFRNQPFEINMAFTTGANVTNQENIFDSDFGLAFAVRNSRFVIAVSTNGTSWDLGEGVGSLTVQPNTTYYIKISWNGTQYVLYYSLDGTTYTADITKSGTSQPYPKQIYIGVGENFASVVNHFSGTINLNNANVKVNGEIFWTGMDDAGISTRADVSLSNIDADGEAKIKEVAETEAINEHLDTVDTVLNGSDTSVVWTEYRELNGIGIETTSTWQALTNFLSCDGLSEIVFTHNTEGWKTCSWWFDENKLPISSDERFGQRAELQPKTIPVPNGAKYFRVTLRNDGYTSFVWINEPKPLGLVKDVSNLKSETSEINEELTKLPTDVLVDETSVLGSDKIARIPRASSDTSGTIKIGNGAQLTSAGTIRATALTKPNYDAANGNTFVGKATLENVLNPIREEINTVEDKFNNLIAPQIFCVNFGGSGGPVVYYDGKDIVLKANGGWTNITYGIFFKTGTYRVSLDSIDGAVGNLEISNYRFGEMPTTGKVIVDKDNLSVDFTYDHDAWGAFSLTNANGVVGNIEFKNAKIVKIA